MKKFGFSFGRKTVPLSSCDANSASLLGRRIVCAANRNRVTGDVVLGVRHWDALMAKMGGTGGEVDQGFMDNRGTFLTRIQAWVVAADAQQIIRRVGGDSTNGGTLYSENLY